MTGEKKERHPEKAIMVIAVSALVLIIGVSIYFDRDGNGGGNGDVNDGPWSDLDELKRSLGEIPAFQYSEVRSTDELDSINDPGNAVYMLIGIERELNSSNYISIKNFIMDGGFVIIADDGTNANRLGDLPLGEGEERIDFIGKPYLVDKTLSEPTDDRGYLYNKYFIKSYSTIGGRNYEMIVHRPNGLNASIDLINSTSANHLLTTSKLLTVIDMNENEVQDMDTDKYTPHGPIAIEYRIGSNNGGIVYISSTGLFTDNVFHLKNNEAWFRAYLTQFLPTGGKVLLDTSKQMSSMSPHNENIPA
ncbi:MAG: hypothetical protein KAH57_08380 [Thermoplasmata archaeon]|nr:hypothetical protein [Thermoplasmata archaeon]